MSNREKRRKILVIGGSTLVVLLLGFVVGFSVGYAVGSGFRVQDLAAEVFNKVPAVAAAPPSPTPTFTPTPEATLMLSPTNTPEPTLTPSPTNTPEPTPPVMPRVRPGDILVAAKRVTAQTLPGQWPDVSAALEVANELFEEVSSDAKLEWLEGSETLQSGWLLWTDFGEAVPTSVQPVCAQGGWGFFVVQDDVEIKTPGRGVFIGGK